EGPQRRARAGEEGDGVRLRPFDGRRAPFGARGGSVREGGEESTALRRRPAAAAGTAAAGNSPGSRLRQALLALPRLPGADERAGKLFFCPTASARRDRRGSCLPSSRGRA